MAHRRTGYKFSPGTLYPILHRLEEVHYLVSYSENIGGKIRKYYRISPAGVDAVKQVKEKMWEPVKEVMN